jgi:hypothetical protein
MSVASPGRRTTFAVCGIAITVFALGANAAVDLTAERARGGIAANILAARGIAAVETLDHTRYEKKKKNATCLELTAAGFEASRGTFVWHDRLRLEVTAGPAAEVFALTNPGRLEKSDVGGLVSGGGSGEFSTFLRNIVTNDADQFAAHGVQQTSLGSLAEFGFDVSLFKSHFEYGAGPASYRGSLFVAPETGDLKRLTMVMDNRGDACRLEYNIDYARVKMGSQEIVLPQVSTSDLLYTDGTELHTETHYSGYHWPQLDLNPTAKSALPAPLPAGLHLKVRLQDPLDGTTAAAGDPIVGIVRSDVKDKGVVVIHAGDRVHGRLAILEQYLLKYWQVGGVEGAPDPRWNVGIVFETIERGAGSQAVEQPVSLDPVDDGDRTPHDAPLTPTQLQQLRPAGGGYFRVYKKALLLDQKFESEWETR